MSNKNLTIELDRKPDKNGKHFFVGKIEGPFTIDCRDGVSFLIFTSEEGAEQLQIANLTDSSKFKKPHHE